MELEIRVKNLVLFHRALDSDCKTVSFGAEGCSYLLPSETELKTMIEAAKEKNKIFKLVTPKVTEHAYEQVVALLKILDEYENTEVTINDWGILSRVEMKNAKVYLGHMINWTMLACPWHENIMRDETKEIAHLGETSNVDSTYKLGLLKKYNVVGVETDYQEEAKRSLEHLEENGIDVLVHYNRISLSFSRTCPTAKHLNLKLPECVEVCRNESEMEISLSKIWDSNETGQHYLETDEEVKDLCHFKIDGNWIYRDGEKTCWDKMIFHLRNSVDLEACKELTRR